MSRRSARRESGAKAQARRQRVERAEASLSSPPAERTSPPSRRVRRRAQENNDSHEWNAVWPIEAREIGDQEIIDAIYATTGHLAESAKLLKMGRTTLWERVKESPAIQKAYEDAREIRIDYVEGELFRAIQRGREVPMLFFLKTQAKHRGYVERAEFTGRDGKPIEFVVKWAQQSMTTNTAQIQQEDSKLLPEPSDG